MQFLAFLRVLRKFSKLLKVIFYHTVTIFFLNSINFIRNSYCKFWCFRIFFSFEIFTVLIFYPNTVNFVPNDFGFYFKMVYSVYSVFRLPPSAFWNGCLTFVKGTVIKFFLSQYSNFFPLGFLRFFFDF